MIGIQEGIVETILDAVASATGNSNVFALPPRASQITWQSSFGSAPASITLQLQTSLDNLIWSTIDSSTSTAGESKTINSSAVLVRARINAISGGSGITVKISCKSGFIAAGNVTLDNLILNGNLTVTSSSSLDNGAITTDGLGGITDDIAGNGYFQTVAFGDDLSLYFASENGEARISPRTIGNSNSSSAVLELRVHDNDTNEGHASLILAGSGILSLNFFNTAIANFNVGGAITVASLFGLGITACPSGQTAPVTLSVDDTGQIIFTKGSCS